MIRSMDHYCEKKSKGAVVNIHDFRLLDLISQIINSNDSSNDVSIARFLINHLQVADSIRVSRIMKEAYVTRAAVRRFCNHLGYTNLSELRSSFSRVVFPSNIRFRNMSEKPEAYHSILDNELSKMFADIRLHINDGLICSCAYDIYQHESVEILSANNISGNLIRFQQEMFYAGKIVRLTSISDIIKEASYRESPNKVLIIVISVSGKFAKEIDAYVCGRTARKVLITAFCNKTTPSHYDSTLFISSAGNGIDKYGIYAKYGITYLLDLLSSCYISRYAKETKNNLFGPRSKWID